MNIMKVKKYLDSFRTGPYEVTGSMNPFKYEITIVFKKFWFFHVFRKQRIKRCIAFLNKIKPIGINLEHRIEHVDYLLIMMFITTWFLIFDNNHGSVAMVLLIFLYLYWSKK